MLYGSVPPGIPRFAEDPPFENCFLREELGQSDVPPAWGLHYRKAAIGVVLAGSFDYRSQAESISAVPGTVIFANSGECLQVRHLGPQKNRRNVAWFSDTLMQELAGELGLDRARFPRIALPPGKAAARLFGLMQRLGEDDKESALELAATALTVERDCEEDRPVATADRQCVLAVVRHIEQFYFEPCTVDDLAKLCGYRRFHFMRLFRAVTGQSVNQFVIAARLRAAALRLRHSNVPVSEVALDVGFNDLSHFNTSFRAAFGCTPRQIRKKAR